MSYGASLKLVIEASQTLKKLGIEIELIDIQTLLPFDLDHQITQSIKKTKAVLFVDEDVPGGASAFMLQKVLEEQNAFDLLELPPKTLTARAYRSAYGSDGDYFSKPNKEDIIFTAYNLMREKAQENILVYYCTDNFLLLLKSFKKQFYLALLFALRSNKK